MKFWRLVLAFFCSLILFVSLIVAIAFITSDYATEDLGNGYQFINEHPKSIVDKQHYEKIPPRIIELGWDKRFIVAVQRPDISCISSDELSKYPQIHDRVFYWIIDKEKELVYGPLSSDEFDQKEDLLMRNHDRIWLNPR